jgi:putative PIN family toxin of toxin-antitoxin system
MLKIVIDTNSLIDGSDDFYNYSSRIIDEVLAGNIEAYANRGTIRENRLLANRKITDEVYLRKLEYFFNLVNPVDNTDERLDVVTADPEDNKILESAVASNADYLITSDRHLLDIEKYNRVRIVRPAEFWGRYEEEGDHGWQNWLKNFIT